MAVTAMLRALLATAALATLAACGTGREDPIVLAVQELTGAVRGDGAPPPVFTAATVPPELVAQLPGPLMLIEVPAAQSSSAMVPVGENRGNVTWRAPNGIGLTLDPQGVMISTRGFGFDLMASDASQTAAALGARRAGSVQRRMVHLDGEAQQARRDYTCSLQIDGPEAVVIAGSTRRLTRIAESCTRADGDRFRNLYWTDATGRAVQSEQWISPEIGSIRITLLRE